MIRVVVADDHQMVRDGMKRIIEEHPDMETVGEAASGEEVARVVGETKPDVLVLDITMPGPGFLEVMESAVLSHPHARVLVVSMHSEKHWAIQALKAGAAGFLTKTHSGDELAEGIRRIHQGGRFITNSLAEALADDLGSPGGSPVASLSRREFEVLRGLGAGRMLKTVARDLDISVKTVSTYKSRIMEKLDLNSTAELIRFAVDHDLID